MHLKIKKELVAFNPKQSFKYFTPRLKNYFFWHYHPEYELVYVEAIQGICHIGQNISGYTGSDLLLIGPNIPHLNFDYGLKTHYHQIVVQLKENFLGTALEETAEFAAIQRLLERSVLGLSFSGGAKQVVAKKLQTMNQLGYFEQLLCLLEILHVLAHSNDVTELNEKNASLKLLLHDKIRMGAVYKYIHAHYNEKPDVNVIAASVHLSTPAFCRYFRKQTRMTFTQFVNQYKISQAKTLLLQDKSVSEVCYEVGFESLSYFNKLFKQLNNEHPSVFKMRYR